MRTERDSMGEMQLPDDALYGASTQRAVLNFPVSGHALPEPFIRVLGQVKAACARVNADLGLLDEQRAGWIVRAAEEVASGQWFHQFPVDVFQTGSGTSTHTNINELIANRVSQWAGEPVGSKRPVHPNDHVNLGQSSNDVMPTVLHVSLALELRDTLRPSLEDLRVALTARSEAWTDVIKLGRTHLMDATPVTLGQVFSGYAAQVAKAVSRVDRAIAVLAELAVGGTAVGTGLNTHPEFGRRVADALAARTGLALREASNHFEMQAARDDVGEVAGLMATTAGALMKIAHDLRMLGSGPRGGIGELRLPAVQPGSSIMPGKVNPVMAEMLVQTGYYVRGLAAGAQEAARDGHFELNATVPMLAHALHEAVRVLAAAVRVFATRCVAGIEADEAVCRSAVERSLMLVTALTPLLGYDRAAAAAQEAFASGRTLREVVAEKGWLDAAALDRALNPSTMAGG